MSTRVERRRFLGVAGASVAGAVAGPLLADRARAETPPVAGEEPLVIVRNGRARAVVVVADDAEQPTQDAAELLVSYVRKSTGATLKLLTESDLRGQAKQVGGRCPILYVGRNQVFDDDPEAQEYLNGLDGDGFLFWPGDNSLTIVGPTPYAQSPTQLTVVGGTVFGVNEFLERYVGVRWLLPGPDGEHVPRHSDLRAPRQLVRDEPTSIHRLLSPFIDPERPDTGPFQYEWALRNRMHDRVSFHHNLFNILPPAKYYEAHPEWYPDGQRPTGDIHWQPAFTADGTVEAAIAEINAFFDANPATTSISLGVNDGGGFCEADPNHPDYPGRLNSIGRVDMSDIYFAWVNDVAEGVLSVHPDKWFGVLAYAFVYDPPSFAVNPRVVPFITDDRMSWAYPEAEEAGHARTEGWAAVSENIAFYDYFYGSAYAVPRVYPHRMAANYRYGSSQGVSAHYAELYPGWGEGPKAWLSAKLQWNPDADVDALLTDWYERAVGPRATPALAAYYARWEQFWTQRVFDSPWFQRWLSTETRSNFMHFFNHSYLELVSEEDITESRRLIESVIADTRTEPQRSRARLLMDRFEYYEAAALSYPSAVPVEAPQSNGQALRLLERGIRRLRMAGRRDERTQEFPIDPILPERQQAASGLAGAGWDSHLFQSLTDWMTREVGRGEPRDWVQALARNRKPDTIRGFARLLLAVVDGDPVLTINSSFEDGDGAAPPWGFIAGGGTLARTSDLSATGAFGIVAEGVNRGGPIQTVAVSAGWYGAVASFQAPADSESEGTVCLTIALFDVDGKRIGAVGGVREPRGRWVRGAPVASTKGQWSTVETAFQIPSEAASAQLMVLLDSFGPGERVYLDDVRLYRLD